MIRVLHTIDTTGPGGAETVFIDLAKGLDPQRFKSVVAIKGPGWVCDTLKKNRIEPIFIKSQGRFNLQYISELINIIKRHKINILQSHLLGSNLYCSLAGLICRIPVISTFHGFVDTSDRERLIAIKSRIINVGSKKIVFVSNRLREHFIRMHGFSQSKAVTIYNGVDTTIFQPIRDDSIRKKLALGREHVLIGAVGNIRPTKGYDYFLRAARLVIDKHPECRFVIAGQGSGSLYEDLLKLRKNLKLEEALFFLGFCENSAFILNNLDIFVLPSISEGFSISTIEAMACNIPVIATRCGGPEEIVVSNENGLIVEPEDEIGLAEAINQVILDVRLRERLVTFGKISVSSRFSILEIIKHYEKMYIEIANPKLHI